MLEARGHHLKGLTLDFVVSGGIASLESPRIVRELRRYGAKVRPIMTKASTEFIRPLALEWAAQEEVILKFSGKAEHISSADAVVVAPCTFDFLNAICLGQAQSIAQTMVQSVLGRKPVILVPSMHDSLFENPIFQESLSKLRDFPKVSLLNPKREESKAKSPAVESIVAQICHILNKKTQRGLILFGPTRSPIDDVRYVSNYSTGGLGLRLADTFYRAGYDLDLIAGPLSFSVPDYLNVRRVQTRQEMLEAVKRSKSDSAWDFSIFAAAGVGL